MYLFFVISFESISIVLDLGHFLLLCLLYFELFLGRCRWGCLGSITLFLFSRFGFSCLGFWYFSLFCPLFVETAIAKHNKPVFGIFQFELNSEIFLFGILGFSQVVSNVLIKSRHCGFVFDQYLDSLFPSELDRFTGWYFRTYFEYHFPLLFGVLIRVSS